MNETKLGSIVVVLTEPRELLPSGGDGSANDTGTYSIHWQYYTQSTATLANQLKGHSKA